MDMKTFVPQLFLEFFGGCRHNQMISQNYGIASKLESIFIRNLKALD
jgi:hypothetical protein